MFSMRNTMILVVLFGAAVGAAQERPMELLGAVGGICRTITLDGDYAYVGEGMGLAIYDISGYGYPRPPGYTPPDAPARLASLTMFGEVGGIAVKDGVAYVAAGQGGLRAVDVRDPASPRLLHVYELPGDVRHLALDGDVLYVGWGLEGYTPTGGLALFEITGFGQLTPGATHSTQGPVFKVVVDGGRVFVLWGILYGPQFLDILDIRDPAQLQLINSVYEPGSFNDLVVANGRAYLLVYNYYVMVCDISEDGHLSVIGYTGWSEYIDQIAVAGDILYAAATWYMSLDVLNVANPSFPVYLSSTYLPSCPYSLAVKDNVVYVGCEAGSLGVVDVTPSAPPTLIAFDGVPGDATDLALDNDRAYVVQENDTYLWGFELWPDLVLGGIQTYDLRDLGAPQRVGKRLLLKELTERSWHSMCSLSVLDNIGYLAWGARNYSGIILGGLDTMDLTDPGDPSPLGAVEVDRACFGIAVQNDWTYLLWLDNLFYRGGDVVDVSDPRDPVILSSESLCRSWTEEYNLVAAIEGKLLFLAYINNDNGYMGVFDASDPATLRRMGFYVPTWPSEWKEVCDLVVSNGKAYVAVRPYYGYSPARVDIVDVSTPYAPVYAGSYAPADADGSYYDCRSVAVAYDRAYVQTFSGIDRVDVSDPSNPILIDTYAMSYRVNKIMAKDCMVYALDDLNGLSILSDHRYPVIISVQGEGTTDPAPGDRAYEEDSVLTITAFPEPGHFLRRWEGDCGECGVVNPLTVTVDGKKSITAVFEEIRYTLTLAREGQGYTDPAPGAHSYVHDTEVTAEAVPMEGWAFDHWTGDCPGDPSANPITVAMDGDKSLTAVFAPIRRNVSVAVEGAGTTAPEPGTHAYPIGSNVQVTALPAAGWIFDHWLRDGGASLDLNPITLTLDADTALTAVFTPIMLSLNLAVEGEGTTTPESGAHVYAHGTEVTVSAAPAAGWRFDHWENDLQKALAENPLTFTLTHDVFLTAVFARVEYALSVQVSGNGRTNPLPGVHSYAEGTRVTVTAIRGTGWQFDHWEGDCGGTPSANPLTVVVDGNRALTAVFTQPAHTLTVAVEGSGFTNPAAGEHACTAGTMVTLLAVPELDWRFDHWEGDCGADPTANPLLMPMDRAKTVTAVFVPAPKPFWSCGSASGEMPRGTGSDIAAVLLSALGLAVLGRRQRAAGQEKR